MYTVSLKELMDEFNLELLTNHEDLSRHKLAHIEINRPALQLAGFYDYFDFHRLQVIGLVEHTYMKKLDDTERRKTFEQLLKYELPGIVICRGLKPFDGLIEFANANNVPILMYPGDTSDFIGEAIRWLKVQLAPRVRMHGVLVDVYGEGLLIIGESGVGKSEAALELVKRDHRLIADDAVDIKKVSARTLIGTCPEVIRHFIELRGVGIIDVRRMFGIQSVKEIMNIDLVIKLENWNKDKVYDRLGLEDEYMEILGNNITCNSVPVRPGRNIAVICEAAAINHRQKKMGYNAAKILNERIENNIKAEMEAKMAMMEAAKS